jgi:hypothetical protein
MDNYRERIDMIDSMAVDIVSSVRAYKPEDETSGLLLLSSVCAWFGEAVLLMDLWSARQSPDMPAAFYWYWCLLPIAHLLPWIAALR